MKLYKMDFIRKYLGKRLVCAALLYCGVSFLAGCSGNLSNDMRNPEERDYAAVLLISEKEKQSGYHFVLGVAQEKVMGEKSMVEEVSEWDGRNLKELAKNYENEMGKDLSLAHLKVILLSGITETGMEQKSISQVKNGGSRYDRFEEEAWREQLLYMLDEENEIAKTCPVLEILECEEFTEFLKGEEEPVGTYLENLLREQERQGIDVPWLKDYLKALRENKEIKRMYLVKTKEKWNVQMKMSAKLTHIPQQERWGVLEDLMQAYF